MNIERDWAIALAEHGRSSPHPLADQYIREQQTNLHLHESTGGSPHKGLLSLEYRSCSTEMARVFALADGMSVPDEDRLIALKILNAQMAPMGYADRQRFYQHAIDQMDDHIRGIDVILPEPLATWGSNDDYKLPRVPPDGVVHSLTPDRQYIRDKAMAEMTALHFPRDKESIVDRCMSIPQNPNLSGTQPWHYQYMADRLVSDGLDAARQTTYSSVAPYFPLHNQGELARYIQGLLEQHDAEIHQTSQRLILREAYFFGVGLAHYVLSETKRMHQAQRMPSSRCVPPPWSFNKALPIFIEGDPTELESIVSKRTESVCPGLQAACGPIVHHNAYTIATSGVLPDRIDRVEMDELKTITNQGLLHGVMSHYPGHQVSQTE
jgi:hypothetical protein